MRPLADPVQSEEGRYATALPGWQSSGIPDDVVIGVLPGEGVGEEVIAATIEVLKAVEKACGRRFLLEFGGKIGLDAAVESGSTLSPEVVDFCESIFSRRGAVLAGPGGGRFVYELRTRFGLFCKLSPVKPFIQLAQTGVIKADALACVDILFVRENTGGLYFGKEERIRRDDGQSEVVHRFSYSSGDIARILRIAHDLAEKRSGRLCLVVKPGGLQAISELWEETLLDCMSGSNVSCEVLAADYAAYELINRASRFDVIVSPNMLGDILADCGGLLLGSRGMTYSGNFGNNGVAVYQTGHGAARDLAGRNVANPVGQMLSAAMMLRENFGLAREAHAIEAAIACTLESGWRTADIAAAGSRIVGTGEMGRRVAEAVSVPQLADTGLTT